MSLIACIDVGSTFTKGLLVSDEGELLANADHRTTVDTDVLEGLDAVLARLAQAGPIDEVRVCSSAGGGLRLAVVGHERVISAEAGYRVGLTSGARVVHVASGQLTDHDIDALVDSRPDIVLLVGGTDGGDESVLRHNGELLSRRGPRVAYVIAGNSAATDDVLAAFSSRGQSASAAHNVIPKIGQLAPASAREVIRSAFVTHVIGGKGLSKGDRFAGLVSGATPDIVLRAVELLSNEIGDVLVVDVGGATTDVYSVVSDDPAAEFVPTDDVVGQWRAARTVEGDLGMRWSAPGVVDAAVIERITGLSSEQEETANRLHDDVGFVPSPDSDGEVGRSIDEWLATTAVTVAGRRHARASESADSVRTPARDLRRVSLIIGSGGVLRHASTQTQQRILASLTEDHAGRWLLPEGTPVISVDSNSILTAAGLLAPDLPEAAIALMRAQLLP